MKIKHSLFFLILIIIVFYCLRLLQRWLYYILFQLFYEFVLLQISLQDNETILSATCTCPRGEFKCHHVAATLIYCVKNVSKTDATCQWSRRKQVQQITTVSDMFTVSDYKALDREVSEEDKQFFHCGLRNIGHKYGFSFILSEEPEPEVLPIPTAEDILLSAEYAHSKDKLNCFITSLAVPSEKIPIIAALTKGQRDNVYWGCYRKHRLTSSQFGRVLTAVRRGRYPPSLFKSLAGNP